MDFITRYRYLLKMFCEIMIFILNTFWFRKFMDYLKLQYLPHFFAYILTSFKVCPRPQPINMGVFQGSALALGPLLFIVFSNTVSLYAGDAAVFQYADDTQVLVSGQTDDLKSLSYLSHGSFPCITL